MTTSLMRPWKIALSDAARRSAGMILEGDELLEAGQLPRDLDELLELRGDLLEALAPALLLEQLEEALGVGLVDGVGWRVEAGHVAGGSGPVGRAGQALVNSSTD